MRLARSRDRRRLPATISSTDQPGTKIRKITYHVSGISQSGYSSIWIGWFGNTSRAASRIRSSRCVSPWAATWAATSAGTSGSGSTVVGVIARPSSGRSYHPTAIRRSRRGVLRVPGAVQLAQRRRVQIRSVERGEVGGRPAGLEVRDVALHARLRTAGQFVDLLLGPAGRVQGEDQVRLALGRTARLAQEAVRPQHELRPLRVLRRGVLER